MGRFLIALLLATRLFAQQNGKLQLHFMDVGQGDGAVVISPQGQVVLFDAGEDMKVKNCAKPLAYLHHLGVSKIDYLFVSHYHYDHIGCIPQVLAQFPLTGTAFDRGASYPGNTYASYTQAVQGHRKTAETGQVIRLDEGTTTEVDLKVIALNGAGITTTNENDLSVALLLTFGSFKAEIGGDLSGKNTATYKDIETPVVDLVGRLDVYKVHHHCSSYSSNETWLTTTRPTVGIISTGDGNGYHHPAADCVTRLHAHNIATYWTETGTGAVPQSGLDIVGGSVVVEVQPGAPSYIVHTGVGSPVTYMIGASSAPPLPPAASAASLAPAASAPSLAPAAPQFAWSRRGKIYHFADCAMVARIRAVNLVESSEAPAAKRLHKNCPTKPSNQ